MLKNKMIVVADLPGSVQTIRDLLGPDPQIIGVYTLHDGEKILTKKVDLIICGLHFNESRMFDFLQFSKSDPLTKNIPFLCFRDSSSDLRVSVIQGLKMVCLTLGADDFVDYYSLKEQDGLEDAKKHFRKIILELLSLVQEKP